MKPLKAFLFRLININNLSRPARLFLLALSLDGLFFSGWSLFFNLYILEAGFSREFLGLVNAMPSIAALVFSVPMGLLSDRLGRKRAMLLGFIGGSITPFLLASVHQPVFMLVMAFLWGITGQLYLLSHAPFMMKVSDDSSRDLLFSLSFGIWPLASSLGNALAGQLPALLSSLFGFAEHGARAYQAVLLVCVVTSLVALIPIALIHEPRTGTNGQAFTKPKVTRVQLWSIVTRPLTVKLALPNLLIGFGAAMLIPYMNLFFVERHHFDEKTLGLLFSLSSLMMGLACFIGPRLAANLGGKVRVVVLGQAASLVFLILIGFSPITWLAVLGFLMRGMLMNMVAPLFDAFAMEQTDESEQGTVNSVRGWAYNAGWAIGPYLSGVVQAHYGFSPLFAATGFLYLAAILVTWVFFNQTGSKNIRETYDIVQGG